VFLLAPPPIVASNFFISVGGRRLYVETAFILCLIDLESFFPASPMLQSPRASIAQGDK
jgi:hypothetical protein